MTLQLTVCDAPRASVPMVVGLGGVAVHPAGRVSAALTPWAVGPLRLATVPVTVNVSPPRAGLAAVP